MLRLQLLGHVHIISDGQTLALSAKAAALLTYLALEGVPMHREQLAALLWQHHGALGNLRVELARLRSVGLDLFPPRSPMLSFKARLDLDEWTERAAHLGEPEVAAWLAQLRGLPLTGLEDLGTSAFGDWVESQRWSIMERVEAQLVKAYRRFAEAGQTQAAELIQARAEALGIELPRLPTRPAPRASELYFERPAEQVHFAEVLEAALHEPQLLLLGGRQGSGKRSFLQRQLAGAGWLLVQVNSAPERRLMQAAIAQSLMRVVPAESRAQLGRLLTPDDSSRPDENLIRLGVVLQGLERPLVVAIHLTEAELFVPDLEYLLALHIPLLLVVTAADEVALTQLAHRLRRANIGDIHQLELGPLSIRAVQAGLLVQQPSADEDALYAQAALLVQQSGGWAPHLRSLLGSAAQLRQGRMPLSKSVRDELLSEIARWPKALARDLARLSMVYDSIDLPLARELLGEGAEDALHQGVERGALTQASAHELVRLPGLLHQSSDLDARLGLASEPLRTVLAGTLTGAQRAALRAQLAHWYLPVNPGLSALYAERAGLDGLAGQARAVWTRARQDQLSVPEGPAAPLAPPRQVQAPPAGPGARSELITPQGYRVGLEAGMLDVTRFGRYAQPSRLSVQFPAVPAGPWRLVVRLDLFRSGAELGALDLAWALGLHFPGADPILLSSEALTDFACGGVQYRALGQLPQGQWLELRGEGAGGPLTLSVRALDLSLTVGLLEVNGVNLLELGSHT